jgi:hypothetical protein
MTSIEKIEVCGVTITIARRVVLNGNEMDAHWDEERKAAAVAFGDHYTDAIASAFCAGVIAGSDKGGQELREQFLGEPSYREVA